MPEHAKSPKKPSEPRAFDSALESSLAGLRLTRVPQPGDADILTAGPEQLTVQPPKAEVVSRLVNFLKKI